MPIRAAIAAILFFFLPHGCNGSKSPQHLKYQAEGTEPTVLALYEGWFGLPSHIQVGYSSHDEGVMRRQIEEAKSLGISAFVVDWYGDREPYIDKSYALLQQQAAKNKFHIAMMYEETRQENGATDLAIADFTMFHDTYLSAKAKGREAYLTYHGRPVIFVFPQGKHTDWNKVRQVVDRWNPAPLLIDENLPNQYAGAFDGFYPWINPGPKGWAPDGSKWGGPYLANFYRTMASKYADKMIVGGAWAGFDDKKASWGLNRHISQRCGKTFLDTFNLWRNYVPAGESIPFVMIETWNDYEEGSAIEGGLAPCGNTPISVKALESPAANTTNGKR